MTPIRKFVLTFTIVAVLLTEGVIAKRIYAQVTLPPGLTVVQTVVLESFSNGSTSRTTSRLSAVSAKNGTALLERDEFAYPNVAGYHYRLLQMTDGRRIDVFDPIKTKSTYYLPYSGVASPAAMQSRQASQCAGKHDQILGTDILFGVPVVKIAHSVNDGDWMQWLAPAFACQQLQQVITWKDAKTGAATGKTSYLATSVTVGEPDPSIFSVPADYVEKPPAGVQLGRLEFKYGTKEKALAAVEGDQCLKRALESKDPLYERYRTPAKRPLVTRARAALGI